MELHSIKPAKGAIKSRKRIARGQGSGKGGTATRGHKGAGSRSGFKTKRAFEGGQMPLQMRLPKRGFKNPNRVPFVAINLDRLQAISEKHGTTNLDFDTLIKAGVVRKTDKVKILGSGELTSTINVTAHAFSESAKQAIEKQGGSTNVA